jgi:hypothetical protein
MTSSWARLSLPLPEGSSKAPYELGFLILKQCFPKEGEMEESGFSIDPESGVKMIQFFNWAIFLTAYSDAARYQEFAGSLTCDVESEGDGINQGNNHF